MLVHEYACTCIHYMYVNVHANVLFLTAYMPCRVAAIISPPVVLWCCVVVESGSGRGGDGGAGSHGGHARRVWVVGQNLRGKGEGRGGEGRGGEGGDRNTC